ncbi:MAG: hypothetical protein ACFE95_09850 [Candidatus Hodarchaeota archaeon]
MKNKEVTFKTFQPLLMEPNNITRPCVSNGMCLIREYLVIVTEIGEPVDVLKERLLKLWRDRSRHGVDILAMRKEAKKLGMELPS